jgi:hypothetical protein
LQLCFSMNNFAVSRCLSFFVCLSIAFGHAATLNLSSNLLTGNLPSDLGKLSELSECFYCVTRACRSATSSTNNFAVLRCLSFYACLSISFVCAAFLDWSSSSFAGNLPSEFGNLSELSECFNCVTRACRSANSSTNNSAVFRCLSFLACPSIS